MPTIQQPTSAGSATITLATDFKLETILVLPLLISSIVQVSLIQVQLEDPTIHSITPNDKSSKLVPNSFSPEQYQPPASSLPPAYCCQSKQELTEEDLSIWQASLFHTLVSLSFIITLL